MPSRTFPANGTCLKHGSALASAQAERQLSLSASQLAADCRFAASSESQHASADGFGEVTRACARPPRGIAETCCLRTLRGRLETPPIRSFPRKFRQI